MKEKKHKTLEWFYSLLAIFIFAIFAYSNYYEPEMESTVQEPTLAERMQMCVESGKTFEVYGDHKGYCMDDIETTIHSLRKMYIYETYERDCENLGYGYRKGRIYEGQGSLGYDCYDMAGNFLFDLDMYLETHGSILYTAEEKCLSDKKTKRDLTFDYISEKYKGKITCDGKEIEVFLFKDFTLPKCSDIYR